MFNKSKLKYFGLGLGYRTELCHRICEFVETQSRQTLIQWLEIVPENHINRGGIPLELFNRVRSLELPIIPHGVNLSIGSASKTSLEKGFFRDILNLFSSKTKLNSYGAKSDIEYDPYLVTALKELFDNIKAPWFSDHLSVTRIQTNYFQELIPVPFTKEAAEIVADNIKFYQDQFQIPFLMENPSYYVQYENNEIREYDFMNLVCQKADCGIMLDINNVYVNATNHRYNANQYINNIDLDRVVQVHIAGHKKDYKSKFTDAKIKILDTHGAAITDEVFELFRTLHRKTVIKAVLLERDSNFDFEEIKTDLTKIRNIMDNKPLKEVNAAGSSSASTASQILVDKQSNTDNIVSDQRQSNSDGQQTSAKSDDQLEKSQELLQNSIKDFKSEQGKGSPFS